jgi:hypothetical protein
MANQVKYLPFDCYQCGMEIVVEASVAHARNYCQACAWNKLGAEPSVIHSS